MATINITKNKKGKMVAKIQVYGKDTQTGLSKRFTKRVYNEDGLPETKFRKYINKIAIEYEEEVQEENLAGKTESSSKKSTQKSDNNKVLTYPQLHSEWMATIKKNYSPAYYARAVDVEKHFGDYLKEKNLYDVPISEITVRDVQLFLNSFTTYIKSGRLTSKLKKELPKQVNFRELAREGILTRSTSYNLRKRNSRITKDKAIMVCNKYNLSYKEYFIDGDNVCNYSVETIKGYRRVLRTVFNEAVRYDWISKNPVCKTKIGKNGGNTTLTPVGTKEVFSMVESKEFLRLLDTIPEDCMNKRIPFKIMLLTGLRRGEVCGLRWNDIDLEQQILYVRRNRQYNKYVGTFEKEPKTETSIRTVPIPNSLVKDLLEYMKWFRLADSRFDFNLDKYYVAVSYKREPVAASVMAKWLKEFEHKHNLKEVTCHGLRHTYCSLLLSQNVPIQTVSKYMGHSDSTITLKVYSHFIPDTKDRAVLALNNIAD